MPDLENHLVIPRNEDDDLRRYYGEDMPEEEKPEPDDRPLCQREEICDTCNKCQSKTITEAIIECHDAMVDFNKTLYGWVMGRIENDMGDER